MQKKRGQFGFTLCELLIALMVSSIVLSAVAVLANATAVASQATDEMGRSQAYLRQVTATLTDLIRTANEVTNATAGGFDLWHDRNADGLVTADEVTAIRRGAGNNGLSIGTQQTHAGCTNITFGYDPTLKLVTVWFSLYDSGQTHRYSATSRLRGSDEHKK